MFPTIQAAVIAATPGSTVAVCPGIYPEQVTITKPLTLLGRAFGNANRATIVASPNLSLDANTLISGGLPVYAQVLVRDVDPPEPVNLIGITVDGSGTVTSNGSCFDPAGIGLAGIVYSDGTTGTVNEVTARNQIDGGCGFGIVAFNDSGTENITIENGSFRDVDNGIVTFGSSALGSPPTLSSTIFANFVTAKPGNFGGIAAVEASEIAGGNFVISQFIGIFADVPSTIANNTIADGNIGIEVDRGGTSNVQSNRLANVGTGITIGGGPNSSGLWPAPTIEANFLQNTSHGIDLVTLGASCPTGLVIDQNVLNDSTVGFNGTPASLGGSNIVTDVDTVEVRGTCP